MAYQTKFIIAILLFAFVIIKVEMNNELRQNVHIIFCLISNLFQFCELRMKAIFINKAILKKLEQIGICA